MSSLHPDKAQLEPVGFSTLSADTLDEFRSSLYRLFSLWFRLGHKQMLLKIISMGYHLKLTKGYCYRSLPVKESKASLIIMVRYPQLLSSRENEVAAGNSGSIN